MHPFLPALAVILLLVADGVMGFIRLYGALPEFRMHVIPLYSVVIFSLISGGGLAWWLRRFGIRFPSWLAILSLLLFALLRLF
jgi:hypothetical protein